MEKLELKHLAPYLPYGLKVKKEDWKSILTMQIYSPKFEDIDIYEVIRLKLKPILRPLSDLTKEIEVNGEIIIPILDLSGYTIELTERGRTGLEWGIIRTLPYCDIEKLFEWHFDVFELIEKGLAIDVNTLK